MNKNAAGKLNCLDQNNRVWKRNNVDEEIGNQRVYILDQFAISCYVIIFTFTHLLFKRPRRYDVIIIETT